MSPGFEREILTAEQRHDETVLLGSRLRDGVSVEVLTHEERARIAALIADELVEGPAAIGGRIVLTRRGRLLADLVVRRILG